MASVDEMEAYCRKWLNDRRGKLRLQRDLYLISGLSDEEAGCWCDSGGIGQSWGQAVFSNWHQADITQRGTPAWDAATVRVLGFPPLPYPAGQPFDTFIDYGTIVRDAIHDHHPARPGSRMGEYDIVCHSMGGLDAFSALRDLDANGGPGTAPDEIANAYNMATLDTPWRGVPNMPIRQTFESDAARLRQCAAITPGSPQLARVEADAANLQLRVTRLTCYGADTASQVEVDSANLYNDKVRHDVPRAKTDYRFIVIPGASHSGAMGITGSVITIANLFDTLTRSDRLSAYA
jgi:hypothetical protein